MQILRELMDSKLIELLDIFLNNPDKEFSLTELSKHSKVNITATFRIIKKLAEKKFIQIVPKGKVKLYKLEKNEKTIQLLKLLEKNITPIERFVEEMSNKKIHKILLNSKDKDSADILIITNDVLDNEIKIISEKIKQNYNFKINYLILSEKQHDSLKNFKNLDIEKNIIYKE
jgi:DNA-binding IscR family transcriptional regulator